jgi:predicted CXXCH cytochrome family protein
MSLVRLRIILAIFLIGSFTDSFSFPVLKQDSVSVDTSSYVSAFAEANNKCFKCHGQQKYQYANDNLGTNVSALMCQNRIIKKNDFYRSNHKSFACTDCHSAAYDSFPHPGELRMEQKFNCLDCHGGDENYAQYHFEEIDAEYQKSVHFKLESEGFTCWKCHDPHTYRITARSRNLKETIPYDNAICLNCHSDFNNYQLLTEKAEISMIEKHEWLPNQALHFASVRCIECHARISDTLMVSHMITPKNLAVRQCNDCHSKNSLLMASLYKYESKEQRQDGFFNGVILNQSYVIGANRNEYLNIISAIAFVAVLCIIVIHIIFRIRKKNKIKTE